MRTLREQLLAPARNLPERRTEWIVLDDVQQSVALRCDASASDNSDVMMFSMWYVSPHSLVCTDVSVTCGLVVTMGRQGGSSNVCVTREVGQPCTSQNKALQCVRAHCHTRKIDSPVVTFGDALCSVQFCSARFVWSGTKELFILWVKPGRQSHSQSASMVYVSTPAHWRLD